MRNGRGATIEHTSIVISRLCIALGEWHHMARGIPAGNFIKFSFSTCTSSSTIENCTIIRAIKYTLL